MHALIFKEKEHSDSTMFHYYYVLLRILATKSIKWTDPTRVDYLTSPQSGRTLRVLITKQVHKSGRTLRELITKQVHRSGRTLRGLITRQVHESGRT